MIDSQLEVILAENWKFDPFTDGSGNGRQPGGSAAILWSSQLSLLVYRTSVYSDMTAEADLKVVGAMDIRHRNEAVREAVRVADDWRRRSKTEWEKIATVIWPEAFDRKPEDLPMEAVDV